MDSGQVSDDPDPGLLKNENSLIGACFATPALDDLLTNLNSHGMGILMKRLMAVVLVLCLQGPAMLLQEVAWAKMLIEYTAERGFARGVVETFDGSHPCELCVKAGDLRKGEGKDNPSERVPDHRSRLAWAEMLPCTGVRLPAAGELNSLGSKPAACIQSRGRGCDAPAAPPPERI